MPFFPHFYNTLIDSSQTQPVPSNWSVVLVDVQDSTTAVASGRYKAVNFLGASPISALRNAFPHASIPFVFGGDGALFLSPPEQKAEILELFCSVRDHALNHLGLHLRVASLPVSELPGNVNNLHYGFTSVGPTEGFWFFRGQGFSLAEKNLKTLREATPNTEVVSLPSLHGLSCRLDPFRSQWGRIINLIIATELDLAEEDLFFKELFLRFLGDRSLADFSPIQKANVSRPWFSSSWELESQLQKGKQKSVSLLLENIVGNTLLKLNIDNPVTGKPKIYEHAIVAQSDWIKMDGSLKLILDLPHEEEKNLISLLEEYESSKNISYGVSFSSSATLVCQLDSGKDHRHLHFVDGTDGGLTRAAQDLKRKLGAAGGT